jgi:beta-glucosidase
MIRALQAQKVVSTTKHFAMYSAPVGGRDGATRRDPHVAPREMEEKYQEPFRMAFQEAGVWEKRSREGERRAGGREG